MKALHRREALRRRDPVAGSGSPLRDAVPKRPPEIRHRSTSRFVIEFAEEPRDTLFSLALGHCIFAHYVMHQDLQTLLRVSRQNQWQGRVPFRYIREDFFLAVPSAISAI
ncbi:hypothetical protein B5V02_20300 [Mesorhizobium kowhaii]|uniref:Uncharacterized protein n=1 Tax=Mesorhizobium kowhaii TaxID=1300272 RepID=A0A2W7C2Y4_9HYPH|nr:hypothetical protein B5V02_20300 [Mesorhizobium kowhaii]